ncbi:MAG TPA: carboxypeptidase-like regulatory domain-containing protein [Hanamia sp.]|nr:carboxypeptidase-like regulatory domain-containing protein [Hanamia sp.]
MKFIFLPLISIPVFSFSQINIKGIICNSKREPLPFTNIVSIKKQNGTTTDVNGAFQLNNLNKNDSLKISNIACYSKLIPVEVLEKNDTIFLEENIKTLDEVLLTNFESLKIEEDLGFINFKNNASFDLKPGGQIAVFIENKKRRKGWIKEVSFKAKTGGKCKCDIRLRLIQPDFSGTKPGLDLLTENVIINSNDLKRTNRINLSSYKILMPKNGVFVGLEWLSSDEKCDKNEFTNILGNMAMATNLVWLNYRDKDWNHDYRPKVPNGNYMTPNIGIKVAY